MIDDLDRSLEALLKRDLPNELVSQVAISFATPDDQFPPSSVTLPAIDIFLYDLRENRELRSNEWNEARSRVDGRYTKTRSPVRVDCSYLVTAWASEGSTAPAEDEHRLLGEVMTVLLRYTSLPSEVLRGHLEGQRPPLPTAAMQSGRLQSLGEFWQALGGKPKAAFDYTVTIAVAPFDSMEGPLVREKVMDLKDRTQVKD